VWAGRARDFRNEFPKPGKQVRQVGQAPDIIAEILRRGRAAVLPRVGQLLIEVPWRTRRGGSPRTNLPFTGLGLGVYDNLTLDNLLVKIIAPISLLHGKPTISSVKTARRLFGQFLRRGVLANIPPTLISEHHKPICRFHKFFSTFSCVA
jgi:hypothetical protein